jgi:hypothetical protein
MKNRAQIKCPECHSTAVRKFRADSSGTGLLIFLFGGLLPALFHASAHSGKMVCVECGKVFSPPVTASPKKLLLVALSLLGLFILLAVTIYLMDS